MIVLDTMVLCEPSKRKPAAPVVRWFASVVRQPLFVTVLTLGEIERGVVRAAERDYIYAQRLRRWLDRTLEGFADRILDLDAEAAMLWGRRLHRRRETSPDLLIAAIALRHGMTVATRNARDFTPTGVPVIDPWAFAG